MNRRGGALSSSPSNHKGGGGDLIEEAKRSHKGDSEILMLCGMLAMLKLAHGL